MLSAQAHTAGQDNFRGIDHTDGIAKDESCWVWPCRGLDYSDDEVSDGEGLNDNERALLSYSRCALDTPLRNPEP